MVAEAIRLTEAWFDNVKDSLSLLPDVTRICLQYTGSMEAYFEKQLFHQVWIHCVSRRQVKTDLFSEFRQHYLVKPWLEVVEGYSVSFPYIMDAVFMIGDPNMCHRVRCWQSDTEPCTCTDPIYPRWMDR